MKKSELLNAIFVINQEVESFYQMCKILDDSKCFKSPDSKAFNTGAECAYYNVLKLISNKLNEIGK